MSICLYPICCQSIVLFEAKYHAESLAGISDLMERCPVGVKSTCSSVQVRFLPSDCTRLIRCFLQAEMYVRLAILATKKEEYDRALQLLSRAQSLEPFRAVPDLKIISFVSGSPLHHRVC